MEDKLHTVLGATGAIGKAVVQELINRQLPYRKVSRSNTLNESNTLVANLLNSIDAERSIKGSTYVYLCIGLPYDSKIWAVQWPQIMNNVIKACETYNAKLIFLDNVYMYASSLPVPFNENTKQNPSSKKGLSRKKTTDLMLKAIEDGRINGLIGRSADFYGEGAVNSIFYISFLENMLKGKTPSTLVLPNIKHTYSNTTDNGKALVELALNDDCYGQVWHLPVGKPITTKEILVLFNTKLNQEFKLTIMPKWVRKFLSYFVPILKEVGEMQYQFEQEYIMSFDKFQNRFPHFKVTEYQNGVNEMVEWFKKKNEYL